jgi:N-acetylneuraminic acid mutarotase
VNELWELDISTYQWTFLNTSTWNSHPPPAREQHTASVVNGDIYIFGGKSRKFPVSNVGTVLFTHHSDEVYNDLWKLSVERARRFTLSWPAVNSGRDAAIPQGAPLYASIDGFANSSIIKTGDGITPRKGLCIEKLTVKVSKL